MFSDSTCTISQKNSQKNTGSYDPVFRLATARVLRKFRESVDKGPFQ